MSKLFLLAVLVFPSILWAQNEQDSIQKLNEVIIETRRISLPFTENSHTISVMDSLEMAVFTAASVDELLQNINGIDVRRRGIEGMQSDLYIRGGNFEQVLILIDGVKMDDLQSGHHSMNAILSPENIERIEVIKGAASRIYGQNAMNGAINIITKKVDSPLMKVGLKAGSFETYGADVGFQKLLENGSVQFHINKFARVLKVRLQSHRRQTWRTHVIEDTCCCIHFRLRIRVAIFFIENIAYAKTQCRFFEPASVCKLIASVQTNQCVSWHFFIIHQSRLL